MPYNKPKKSKAVKSTGYSTKKKPTKKDKKKKSY
jgi:hypothetical protein|tara:strand:- start:728 stop:829 length:102 start_codon:yes stop_codon:yes gene_type:complete